MLLRNKSVEICHLSGVKQSAKVHGPLVSCAWLCPQNVTSWDSEIPNLFLKQFNIVANGKLNKRRIWLYTWTITTIDCSEIGPYTHTVVTHSVTSPYAAGSWLASIICQFYNLWSAQEFADIPAVAETEELAGAATKNKRFNFKVDAETFIWSKCTLVPFGDCLNSIIFERSLKI